MSGEAYNPAIDAEQQSIQGLQDTKEHLDSDQTVKLANYQAQFFEEVNELQKIQVQTPEAQKYLEKGEAEVLALLRRAVNRGMYLQEAESRGEKPLASTPDRIDKLAKTLQSTTEKYRASVPQINAFETKLASTNKETEALIKPQDLSKLSSADLKKLQENVESGLQKQLGNLKEFNSSPLLQDVFSLGGVEKMQQIHETIEALKQKKLSFDLQAIIPDEYKKFVSVSSGTNNNPSYQLTAEGKKLTHEKQDEILTTLGELHTITVDITNESFEALASPPITQNYWNGLAELSDGNIKEAKIHLKTFLESDLKNPEFSNNPHLQKRTTEYESKATEALEKIDLLEKNNQKFFQGREAFESGDIHTAKKLLTEYVQEGNIVVEGKNQEGLEFHETAEALLKQIFGFELKAIWAKLLPIMHERENDYRVNLNEGAEGSANISLDEFRRNQDYYPYFQALTELEQAFTNGQIPATTTFQQAYEAIASEKKLDPNAQFNYLADQSTESEGRPGLLKLAQKYRATGQYALAEEYYMRYFSKQMQETAQVKTFEQVRDHYVNKNVDDFNDSIESQLAKAKALYEKQSETYKQQNPWTPEHEEVVKKRLIDDAISGIYDLEIQKEQQRKFNLDPSSLGGDEEQKAWKDFANMKGIHWTDKVYEGFAMSDEEMREFIQNRVVDIALIAATGGVGALAYEAVAGRIIGKALTTAVARQGVLSTIRTGGWRAGGRLLAGATAGKVVENTVFTTGMTAFRGLQEGGFDGITWKNYKKEWAHGLLTLSALGVSGYAAKAYKFGTLRAITADIGVMTAVNGGKFTKDDAAMLLGLKLGHKIVKGRTKEVTKIEESPEIQKLQAKKTSPAPESKEESGKKAKEPLTPESQEAAVSKESSSSEKPSAETPAVEPPSSEKLKSLLDDQIQKAKEAQEKAKTPEQKEKIKQRIESLEALKANLDDTVKSREQVFQESKKIPIYNESGEQIGTEDVFENYKTKAWAYSPEMAEMISNPEKLTKEGPILVKHGGDEILIIHQGPEGPVIYFADISNMGPTNDFAVNIKGSNVNMVDIYLGELGRRVKSYLKPGTQPNPAEFAQVAQGVANDLFGLAKDPNGKAKYDAIKKKYNLAVEYDQPGPNGELSYQDSIAGMEKVAQVRAEFRETREKLEHQLDKDHPDHDPALLEKYKKGLENAKKHPKSGKYADETESEWKQRITREFQEDFFADYSLQQLPNAPTIITIVQQNYDAISPLIAKNLPKGPTGQPVKRIDEIENIFKKTNPTADEKTLMIAIIKSIPPDQLPPELAKMKDLLPPPMKAARIMGIDISGMQVPKEGLSPTQLKYSIDTALEKGLKKSKKTRQVETVKTPIFDQNGDPVEDLSTPEARKEAEKSREKWEEAKADRKPERVQKMLDNLDQSLQNLRNRLEKMSSSPDFDPQSPEAMQAKAEYDTLLKERNKLQYEEPDSGAKSNKWMEVPFEEWYRDNEKDQAPKSLSEPGSDLIPSNAIFYEFYIDVYNGGAANGVSYATLDNVMRVLNQKIHERGIGGGLVNVRQGGGLMKIVFTNKDTLPPGANLHTLTDEIIQMTRDIQPEVDQILVNKDQYSGDEKSINPNLTFDDMTRRAVEPLRPRGKSGRVGKLTVTTGVMMENGDLQAAAKACIESGKIPVTMRNVVGQHIKFAKK